MVPLPCPALQLIDLKTKQGVASAPRCTSRLIRIGAWCAFACLIPFVLGCSAKTTTDSASTKETWDAYFIRGTKVGYGSTRISQVTENNKNLSRIDGEIRMRVRRNDQMATQRVQVTSLETETGKLVRFESRMASGLSEVVTRGHIDGRQLVISTASPGHNETRRIAWHPGCGGFFAVENSLADRPMKPGESRHLSHLMQLIHSVVDVELTADDYETVALLGGSRRLLRIRVSTQFDSGTEIESLIWTDTNGEIHKSVVAALNQESYRTTRDTALKASDKGGFDVLDDLIVKIARPLTAPHSTKRIAYRARLSSRDPSTVFLTGVSQQVLSHGPNEAEIVVHAIRPNLERIETDGDGPTENDLLPNSLIQSDDLRIKAMAERVGNDGNNNNWELATALEQVVHEAITEVDFSHAIATAAEVAQSLKGDCTEHAVLLAALCRARDIPARVAIGLVYFAPQQGFAYHMWNEVWIDNCWIPLDATLGRGGIGAAHLKLSHSDLAGTGAFGAFLPVIQVMGQLELEVKDVQRDN